MKKIVLFIVFISLVGYHLTCNQTRKMPEVVLANVEALASGETSTDCQPDGNGCLSDGLWFPNDREVNIW